MTELPDLSSFDLVIFDLDGVLTPTAVVHMHAWRELFTSYFAEHGLTPAYTDEDYFTYLDGKPRYDGVASLLESRGVNLIWGSAADSPDAGTVCGLGNRKNLVFSAVLAKDGVAAYPGSLALLELLAARGTRLAVASSSKNAVAVLSAAGLSGYFPTVVDGLTAEAEGLTGKPAPDIFLRAAAIEGVPIDRAVVVEDAISGVAAARSGDFGLVVGVDRGVGAKSLLHAGADLVVSDLDEFVTAAHQGEQ